MKNIVLIGMMGSAKSTTGKILAKKLNRPFFDGDDVYVSVYGEKFPTRSPPPARKSFASAKRKSLSFWARSTAR